MQSFFLYCILKERLLKNIVTRESCCSHFSHTTTVTLCGNEYLAVIMHYEFTYKQRKILADFTRYFSTGSFVCENCAPLQSCVTCWFVFLRLWQNFAIRCWIHSKWTIQWERDRRRRCETIDCCKRGQTTQSSEEGFVTFFFFSLCAPVLYSGWRVTLLL